MMRRTPLKSSGFGGRARPLFELAPVSPRPAFRIDPGAWKQVTRLPSADPAEPVEKRNYVRSKRLREAYRLIPCQHCGRDDGTVCCAHANWAVFGKGGSVKASDDRAASLCFACHAALDQGSSLSREERKALWWAAHVKTLRLLSDLGLWPKEIPVPDTRTNPWRFPE